MRRVTTKLFLSVFIAMIVTASGLILSIPPLFGPHEPYQAWITGVLGVLAVTLAIVTLILRRSYDPFEQRSGRAEEE